MGESLKKQTVAGVVWSSLERFSVQGVQFLGAEVKGCFHIPQGFRYIVGL